MSAPLWSCSPLVRLLVFLVALLPFCSALGNDFLRNFDDGRVILEQPFLRDASFQGLLSCLSVVPFREEPLPIRDLSYWLNFTIHGAWAPGFVAVNLALHGLTSVALLGLGRRVFRRGSRLSLAGAQVAALGAALVFAFHPLHSESVVWISARKDVLSGLLYVGSATLWLDHLWAEGRRRRALYLGCAALYLLALGSKSSVVSLPGILFVADLWLGPARPWRRRLRALLPFALLTLAYVKGYTWLLTSYDAVHEGDSVLEPRPEPWLQILVLTDAHVLELYLRGFWLPLEQRVFTLESYQLELNSTVLRGLIVTGLALAAALWAGWRSRSAAFLTAWFGLALVPFLNLIPTGILYADRYAYLPSVGGCLLVGLGATKLLARWSAPRPRRLLLGVLLAALSIPASLRCAAWARAFGDPGQLWERVLTREPHNWVALNGLAVHCAEDREGRPRDATRAEALYLRLMEARPNTPRYPLRLGELFVTLGREEDALALFRRAAATPPDGDRQGFLAYAGLLAARARRGAPVPGDQPAWLQAAKLYEHLIRTWPRSAQRPSFLRARVFHDAGQRSAALAAYRRYLSDYGFSPGHAAQAQLAAEAIAALEAQRD